MRLLIANAFSLSMLDRDAQGGPDARIPRPVPCPRWIVDAAAADGAEIVSVVGHADTAALFSGIIGIPVAANRATITLGPEDRLLVGQYIGPRLPEGATALPEGARIEWWWL